ncbi:MAG: DNA internalization-related competence protein ComEC/Rec2 [Peptoniphilaceae bacterium]
MFYIFLSTFLGIILSTYFHVGTNLILFFIFSLFMFFLIAKKRKYKYICILLIFFLTGVTSAKYYNNGDISGSVKMNATIIDEDLKNENKYIIKTKNFYNYIIYTNSKLSIGDKVFIEGENKEVRGKMNYCDFNYKNYLKSQYINSIITVKKVKIIGNSKLYRMRYFFKSYVNDSFKYLSEKNKNLMMGILLGDNKYISDNTLEVFRSLGLSHILAMSGLHIGILAMLLEYFLALLFTSKKKRRFISILLIFIYIYLAGFPLGALRAYIMYFYLYLCLLLKNKYSSLNALFISATTTLIMVPYSFYSLSFIFSYLSVLGIIFFYKYFISKLVNNFIGKSLAITLSVGIILYPVSMYFFKSYSILGLISNIIILPLYSLATIIAYFILFFKFLSFLISPSLDLILNLGNYLSLLIYKYSDIFKINLSINIFEILVYYLTISLFYIRKIFKDYYKFNKFLFIYILLITIFIFSQNLLNKNYLKIDFIYVGQGDSSLIRYKNKNILIDTGGSRNINNRLGEIYTLNYLKSKGVNKIDYLFLTHFDQDHSEGLLDLIDEIKIDKVFISYLEDNKYIKNLFKRNIDTILVKKGDQISLDKKTYINILSDPKDYEDANNKSMIILLNHRGFKTLFTGDIDSSIEKDIDLKIHCLHVAHHGSKDSTSLDFLDRTKPKLAVISAGINNSYNHPSEEVLSRLNSYKIDTKITNRDGEVNLIIKRNKIYFKSYKEKRYNFGIIVCVAILTICSMIIYIREFGEYFGIQKNIY